MAVGYEEGVFAHFVAGVLLGRQERIFSVHGGEETFLIDEGKENDGFPALFFTVGI